MSAGVKHGPVLPWRVAGIVQPGAEIRVPNDQRQHIWREGRRAGHSGQRQEAESHREVSSCWSNANKGREEAWINRSSLPESGQLLSETRQLGRAKPSKPGRQRSDLDSETNTVHLQKEEEENDG